jgi:multicomponent Na+:H+ antiporter subunit D
MLASSYAIIGAAMHIAMHALAKITLFFCAGGIMVASHKTDISQMRGLGWRMPITMAAFLAASLSLIGLPFLGGMWSKWFLLIGAHEAGYDAIIIVYLVSGLLSALYLLPVCVDAF